MLKRPLTLSLFPGLGLLDAAFEEEGFCIVRGPDALWGGDVGRFHPPTGVFEGVIGGPPCQSHSSWAALNRSLGNTVAVDLISEFARCVLEASPKWWLMENVPQAPSPEVPGYVVSVHLYDNRWAGGIQERRRAFHFGTRTGTRLALPVVALEACEHAPTVLANGLHIKVNGKRTTRRGEPAVKTALERQGFPSNYLDGTPFTVEGKLQMVGNGVPRAMGLTLARAIRQVIDDRADAA